MAKNRTRKAKAQMRSGNAASSLEQRRLDRQRRLDIQNAAVAASSRAAYVREVSAPKNSTLYEERQKKSSRANLLTEPRNSTNSGSANTKGNQKSTSIVVQKTPKGPDLRLALKPHHDVGNSQKVREEKNKRTINTCKSRPDNRVSKGGPSRGFIPWCKK